MPPRLFPSYKIDRDDSTVKSRPKEKGELEGSEKMGKNGGKWGKKYGGKRRDRQQQRWRTEESIEWY